MNRFLIENKNAETDYLWNLQIIKTLLDNFRDCYHLLGEEIDFSSLMNEFSTVSPEGMSNILRFPCGEIIENSFLLNENSISSPQEWEKFQKLLYCYFIRKLLVTNFCWVFN